MRNVLDWYRCELFGRGVERLDPEGRVSRRGLSAAKAEAVINDGGRLPRAEYLRLRIRYFTDGAVLGSREFVDRVFKARRKWFGGSRRSGARRLRGLARDDPLRTMRALSVRVIGSG